MAFDASDQQGTPKNCAAPYNATRGEALGCEDTLSAYKIVFSADILFMFVYLFYLK
jgi:hypothetical protein